MRRHVILILLTSVLLSAAGTSRESGIDSDGDEGCNCHGVRGELQISFTGLPDSFESSGSYNLSIVLGEGKDTSAGFRLVLDGGEISSRDTDSSQELDGGWTHTFSGNSRSVWNFTWIAPLDNSTLSTFILHVNDANGDGEYTSDEWDSRSFAIPGDTYEGEVEAPELVDGNMSTTELVIATFALLLIGGVVWYSMRE